LRGELLGSRLLGMEGLLTPRHPYHRDADVTHFLARRNGRPVGRISAAINHRFNQHYGVKIGFFGFFEVIQDYSVASALLDKARQWVRERGMTILRGPGEYSNATHERQGILIEGFDAPPTNDCTHNPIYYQEFIENYGFIKAKDYYAYLLDVNAPSPPVLKEMAEIAAKRRNIRIRPLVMKDLVAEVHLIVKIYNESFAQNWGFLPVTDEESDAIAKSLRLVADPGLVRFAYVDNEPAGVLGAFPDPNYALRPRWHWFGDPDLIRVIRLLRMKKHIPRTRLMFLGIRPDFRQIGIDAILFHQIKEYASSRGYLSCECSLLLEDNFMVLSPSSFMGAKQYKTWRIYDLPV
jgi:GNAT superfamily N-acetyltransferase